MIKQTPVEGARKDSYASTRPTMTCDTKGCKSKIDGNAGGGEELVKDRAHSLGWLRDTKSGADMCPVHIPSGGTQEDPMPANAKK